MNIKGRTKMADDYIASYELNVLNNSKYITLHRSQLKEDVTNIRLVK